MDLKQKLINFSIENIDKIVIWLVYKNLRRSASFSEISRRPDLEDIFRTLQLKYRFVENPNGSYYLIAKNDDDVSRLESCVRKYDFSDLEAHRELGLLYGFPLEAVEAYVQNLKEIQFQNFHNLVGVQEFHQNFNQYWKPYVAYLVRRGYEMEDTQLAKSWADEIRKELPDIAKAYEKEMEDPNVK